MKKFLHLARSKSFQSVSVLMFSMGVLISGAYASSGDKAISFAQQQTITGNVSSDEGPMPGVTVSLAENPAMSVSTDANGNFSIQAKEGQVLWFTTVGFNRAEKIATATPMNVFLTSSFESLEEVVVVGYGTQKKESLTGALSTLKGDDLRDITSASVEDMLNGKAAGVYVSPGSGKPGARGAVVIRGQATLSGTTSPLWVIDGVIVGSGAGDLNPDDIESMTILKDAASTAIYGSQGANGVVVVTTKNPRAQKTTVTLSSKIGFNELYNGNMQVMNGSELYDYFNSFANPEQIKFPRWNADLRNSNFDWWDVATRKGFTQNHNLSIQGGTEQLQSYLSVGVYDEKGAVKGYDFGRYNARLKTVYKPFEWLSIKPSISGARRGVEDRQYSTTAMYSNLPWDSPYTTDGQLVPHRYNGWVNSASTNYLYDLQWDHAANTNYELNGNFDFDIKLTDWLSFASVNNYRYNSYAASGYTDPRSSGGESVKGRITDYRSEYARRYTNQILRFNKSWSKHSLNALAAYEFNDYWAKTLDVYGTGFIPGFEVLDVVAKPERTKGAINEWAVQSFLSKAIYSYDGKYLAEASFRRDGASNFGDNAKYGNFFSVSGGWNLHKEDWFKVNWIDELKVRASYGSVGNRPSALYPQYDLYSVSAGASYDENSGALINQIGNRDLTWEKTYTSGAGIDASFFNRRLWATFDAYHKNTDNILYQVPISGLTGVTSMWRNIGEMQNRGIELNIGGELIRTDDLSWTLDVNLAHNTNKLTRIYETKDENGNFVAKPIIIGDGLGIAGSAQRVLEPGQPVDTYYLVEWAGVNPDNGAPMWYKDQVDTDGKVSRVTTSKYSEANQVKSSKASPKFFGGFATSVRYKQFDLGAVFGYSLGGKLYNYARQEYDADGTYTDRNQMRLMKDWSRWEKPGDIATHPIAKYDNQDKGNSVSTRYLEKGDYLKMRSLSLGYTFDLPQYHVKNMRVFFSGENLFTLTKYSGVDPEISINENTGAILGSAGPGVYPSTRMFMFGLNVSF